MKKHDIKKPDSLNTFGKLTPKFLQFTWRKDIIRTNGTDIRLNMSDLFNKQRNQFQKEKYMITSLIPTIDTLPDTSTKSSENTIIPGNPKNYTKEWF